MLKMYEIVGAQGYVSLQFEFVRSAFFCLFAPTAATPYIVRLERATLCTAVGAELHVMRFGEVSRWWIVRLTLGSCNPFVYGRYGDDRGRPGPSTIAATCSSDVYQMEIISKFWYVRPVKMSCWTKPSYCCMIFHPPRARNMA